MKRILSVILFSVMILSVFTLVPFSANAQETDIAASSAIEGDYSYNVSAGHAIISRYNGNAAEVIIPSTLGGYPVTVIGKQAFQNNKTIQSVMIPDSVTEINSHAFHNCSSLESADIPDSVLTVGVCAFDLTPYLDSRPQGVVYIGKAAYTYKGDKGNVPSALELKEGTFSITDAAFSYCKFQSITLPDSVITIGSEAFRGCDQLQKISFGNSVKTIGGYTFYDCKRLQRVDIPDSVETVGWFSFFGCSALRAVTIGNCVTSIGSSAFKNCLGFKSVTIPASVTFIGDRAFGCYHPGEEAIMTDFVISGYKGTEAEKYAKTYGLTFIALDEAPTEPPTDPAPPTESEPPTDPAPSYIIGDTDSDGVVTIIDATQIQKKLAQLPVLPGFNEDAARVDGEQLNITQATYIQKWLASLPVPYPIGEPSA